MSRFQDYLRQRQAAPPGSPLAEAAITLGVPVFPCAEDKRPLTAHGFKDATVDPARIRAMFADPRAVLIGVPTGRTSGWAVVDVDVKNGAEGQAWLDANSDRLPPTRTHVTRSGGWHLVFRMPAADLRNSAGRIAPGVDVRAEGGYVIVPPSAGYQSVPPHEEPMDMPDWLIEAAMPPQPAPSPAAPPRQHIPDSYAAAALDGECRAVTQAREGTRNHTLNVAAVKLGSLVAAGLLTRSTVESELTAAARAAGLPGPEIAATLRSGMGFGTKSARAIPERTERDAEVHPAAPFLAKLHAKAAQKEAKPLPVTRDLMAVDGVLKLLVDECVRTAIRPQPFLALGAAICVVGALAGRQYRTGTDLRTNIYISAIGESGSGKDHTIEIVRRAIEAADLNRYLGGEKIASGQALITALEGHPSKLFQIDEFGLFLSSVTGKKVDRHRAEIWSELLKLYSRAKGIYRGTEYANQKEKPRIDIHQPCVCFYGTTTPSTFWDALAGGAMTDGSLARFLVFVTDDNRPPRNKSAGIFTPSPELVEALQALARGAGATPAPGNLPALHVAPMAATTEPAPYTVPITGAADRLHDQKLEDEDAWARRVEGTPQASVVNRLGENAIKLALVRAISHNPAAPVIDATDVGWGWAIAEHCARSLLQDAGRFISNNEFEAKLNKALDIIRKHGPVTPRDLFRFGFKVPDREKADVLRQLAEAGLIQVYQTNHPGGGRPTIKYAAIACAGSDETSGGDGITS